MPHRNDFGHDCQSYLLRGYGANSQTNWCVNTLKLLVITNYDEDHVSGLPNLASKVTVQNFVRNATVSAQTLLALKSESGHGPGIGKLTEWITNTPVWDARPEFLG